jgi:hypothetical protein
LRVLAGLAQEDEAARRGRRNAPALLSAAFDPATFASFLIDRLPDLCGPAPALAN